MKVPWVSATVLLLMIIAAASGAHQFHDAARSSPHHSAKLNAEAQASDDKADVLSKGEKEGSDKFLQRFSKANKPTITGPQGNKFTVTVKTSSHDDVRQNLTNGSTSFEPCCGGADGWLVRFPKIRADALGAADAQRFAKIWTALGSNMWMEFIDGRAHAGGPHVWDKPDLQHNGKQSGTETFKDQDREFHRFSNASEWGSRWTASKLAAVNAAYQGKTCKQAFCTDMFDPRGSWSLPNASRKQQLLVQILEEYYNAIDGITIPMSKREGTDHICQAVPLIARLYHNLAILHPFEDGNSRVRTLVLQTELVRQGGHPTILWDNYWGIYNIGGWIDIEESTARQKHSYSLVVAYILDGWCAWEMAYNRIASPFAPFIDVKGSPASDPRSFFNNQTGVCEQGPAPSWWEEPFVRPHQKKDVEKST